MVSKLAVMSLPRVDHPQGNTTLLDSYVTTTVGLLNQSADEEVLLQRINDRKAALLLPDILMMVFFLLLGLLGNPLAIYIYGWRWKLSSIRIFLFALAVIDLMNCLVTIPMEIVSLRNYYHFPSERWCIVSRFTTYVLNNATVVIFLSIAVDRYIRICHPYKTMMSARNAKVACGISLLIGLTISWPVFFLYGMMEIKVPVESDPPRYVVGVKCARKISMSYYSRIFFIFLSSAFSVDILILVVLYTVIGCAILKQKRSSSLRRQATATMLEKLGRSTKNVSVNSRHVPRSATHIPRSSTPTVHSSTPTPRSSTPTQRSSTPTPRSSTPTQRSSTTTPPPSLCMKQEEESLQGSKFSLRHKKFRLPKATLMLFLITVVFVTSFLPFLIIAIIREHLGLAFYLNLSPTEQIVYNLFGRSYVINNCTNPIVYGLCNSQFRQECKRLFWAWCSHPHTNVATVNTRQNSVPNRWKTLCKMPRLERKVSPEH